MSSAAYIAAVTNDSVPCPYCKRPISRARLMKLKRDEERALNARARAEAQKLTAQAVADALRQAEVDVEARLSRERDGTWAKAQAMAQQARAEIQARHSEERRQLAALAEARQRELGALAAERDRLNHELGLLRDALKGFTMHEAQLEKTIETLERQIAKRTPNELGGMQEIDLHDALQAAFAPMGDRIEPLRSGVLGGDIRIRVIEGGAECGTILIESKNAIRWESSFLTKLVEDKNRERATLGVLATRAFPRGRQGFSVYADKNVVLITPACVVPVVQLFRRQLADAHRQGLGLKQSHEKLARFQNLLHVNGPWRRFVQTHTERIDRVRDQLQKERTAVTRFWKERESIYDHLSTSAREIDSIIADIAMG